MSTASEHPHDRVRAVVLAGGRGRRLEPFTTILPKPLAPLGQRPILDILLQQLRRDGLTEIVISLGYLGELIQAYLAGRPELGVSIRLVREEDPRGTAGALALVEDGGDDLLVVNGDVLTDLRFTEVIRTHRRTGAALTVAIQQRHTQMSYGVVETDGDLAIGYREKPQLVVDCAIGVNVYGRAALAVARSRSPIDLPDVVGELLARGETVAVHRHDGYWRDIGTRTDYERAQEDWATLERTIFATPTE